MPSVSRKQHNFMMAVAHSEKFAKKVGVPVKVGLEYEKADMGKRVPPRNMLVKAHTAKRGR